ncbi:MAG: leucyl-tRNA synthetase [Planctomycetota bacterium]|jgi:leucyl-tRNA synthetase
MEKYNHKGIEKKWQDYWRERGVYRVSDDASKPKMYVLDMFPYPSGSGLHVGHPRGYIGSDVYSRFKRMNGFRVLHPMGWDAFGLPAENYAIKHQIHPSEAVSQNVARYKEQLSAIGFDYDWDREVNTTDPEFYKWTQWIFLQLYKKGLAYQSHEPINWCPECQTGLANEDLESDGTCERCGALVEKRPMRQWVLKITDYADRLIDDLDLLDKWPESVKEAQRNWIGRSEGAAIHFPVSAGDEESTLEIFTTRPDTLFGATYMVVAPEHPLLHTWEQYITNIDQVKEYVIEAGKKTTIDRTNDTKEKTGVLLEGITATNPVNREEIPVYVADYVLIEYGTGAIMAVPAHDERDFAFAKKYELPIRQVIAPETGIKRENEEFRDGGAGVIFDPQGQKYAMAKWKNDGEIKFYAGGVDDGEDMQEGVLREIREESGLYDFGHVEFIEASFAHYYNSARKVNRVARSNAFLVILNSIELQEVIFEEHEDFELLWMHPKEILTALESQNENGDYSHYIRFLKEGVGLARERGFDTATTGDVFVRNPHTGTGILQNSGEFTGKTSEEAKRLITEAAGGKMTTTYRLKDWVFSRQRYWGEPIPVVHVGSTVYPIDESQLPVTLPKVESYAPTGTGESPLADITDWVEVSGYVTESGSFIVATAAPSGEEIIQAERETNTMPNWAGSSWYWLRYIDSYNTEEFLNKEKASEWSPVDLYVGGVEHATRHLIYGRFWHKFLYDQGYVNNIEPFMALRNQGLIMAEDGRKMSKRWGNVVNPDDVVAQVGADSLRLYEMFIAPFENSTPWSTDGLVGTRRFLEKVWRQQGKLQEGVGVSELTKSLHKTIQKVSRDIEGFKMNTAVSAMMIHVNSLDSAEVISKDEFMLFLQILAPFAPHLTEELWQQFGEEGSIHVSGWPDHDVVLATDEMVSVGIQINGKKREVIEVSVDADEETVREAVLELENVQKWVAGKEIKMFKYVPGRIVTIVV